MQVEWRSTLKAAGECWSNMVVFVEAVQQMRLFTENIPVFW